jgi:hypothetical protein
MAQVCLDAADLVAFTLDVVEPMIENREFHDSECIRREAAPCQPRRLPVIDTMVTWSPTTRLEGRRSSRPACQS